jgi:lipopolysaccharide export system ATP-binding protein
MNPAEKEVAPQTAGENTDEAADPGSAPFSSQGEQQQPLKAGNRPDDFLLRTQELRKVYDGRAVVKDVEINVRPGEIVGLLGPNGAGKTTSFYMIVGLVAPTGGRVFFNNENVTSLPMYRRARLGMGYLPQEESIFRKLSVHDNIMAVMETMPLSKEEKRQRCHNLLERFGIAHVAGNLALTLSGGEKRRLTIARSLVTEPKLLMLDEPFSGVDPIAVSEIQDIITNLREAGLAILITDHNVRETLSIVDRAYLIFEGSVERQGTREFLVNDPMSRELYLGERFSM